MILSRPAARAVLALLLLAGCGGGDPRIGLELTYEATGQVEIRALWLDGVQKLGARDAVLHVGPQSTAHEAWSTPGGADAVPREIRAQWRYAAIDPIDEAALQALPEGRAPWREASATIRLREAIDADALALLRDDPKRHRLKLVLVFDRDRLDVRWQVRRWR